MNEVDQQPYISWGARPWVLLVLMPVAAVGWLVLAGRYDASSSQNWRSVLLGVPLGLIAVLANRVVVRKRLDFFVDFYLRPIPECSPANSFWQRFLHTLPLVGPMWAMLILGEVYLHAFAAGMAALNMVWLLTYPEQVLIYRTAKQRIGQPRSPAPTKP